MNSRSSSEFNEDLNIIGFDDFSADYSNSVILLFKCSLSKEILTKLSSNFKHSSECENYEDGTP